MTAADGKQRLVDVADTEQLLRLIQSIPSRKAEPFKRWLASVGYQRLEKIENPELAAKRMRAIYEQKGYSEDWIEKRLRGIAVRDELTDEWKKRGVKERKEFAILTAEISKATFGICIFKVAICDLKARGPGAAREVSVLGFQRAWCAHGSHDPEP